MKSQKRILIRFIFVALIAILLFAFGCTASNLIKSENSNKVAISGNIPLERPVTNTVLKSLVKATNSASTIDGNIIVTDLKAITVNDIINNLIGDNVTLSNIVYTGAPGAAGTFSNASGIFGFDSGIILSSGTAAGIIGPNNVDNFSIMNNQPGDASLDALIPGYTTHDACVLEFDFIPLYDYVVFEFIFASEEYNEYVNTSFNDVFGFFLNGTNIALIPETTIPVAINNVNGGNPFGTNASHADLFKNNDLNDGGGLINTQMDGFTVPLTVKAKLKKGQINHIKLVIADAGDSVLDSNILIKAKSFTSDNPPVVTADVDRKPNVNGWYNSDVTVTFTAIDADETPVASITDPITVSTEGASQVITGTAVDTAGLIGTATMNINLDETAPVVTINAPTAVNYLPSESIVLDFGATDALSGIDSATLTAFLDGVAVTNGQTLNLSTLPGAHVLSISVSDKASNSAIQEVAFTVKENTIIDVKPDKIFLEGHCHVDHHGKEIHTHNKCDKNKCDINYNDNEAEVNKCIEKDINDSDENLKCGGFIGHEHHGHGFSIRAYIQMQSTLSKDIDPSSVTLTVNGKTFNAKHNPVLIYDYDKDGIKELMVTFDWNSVLKALDHVTGNVVITVDGKLFNGTKFSGTDIVKVLRYWKHKYFY